MYLWFSHLMKGTQDSSCFSIWLFSSKRFHSLSHTDLPSLTDSAGLDETRQGNETSERNSGGRGIAQWDAIKKFHERRVSRKRAFIGAPNPRYFVPHGLPYHFCSRIIPMGTLLARFAVANQPRTKPRDRTARNALMAELKYEILIFRGPGCSPS